MATSALARTELEALLRTRKLDRTVVRPAGAGPDALLSTGIAALDERLGGGLPRGQMSEIVGARSSGRTSLMCAVLAAATARGDLSALVDAADMLDPESAAACGIALTRLLWVRGEATSSAGPRAAGVHERQLDRAVKALNLVLQAGSFDLAVFDLAEMPMEAIRRLPFTTWFRLQRVIEGSRTACVVIGPAPVARSAEGVSLQLARVGRSDRRAAGDWHPRLFLGLDIEARIVRSRDPEHRACRMRLRA